MINEKWDLGTISVTDDLISPAVDTSEAIAMTLYKIRSTGVNPLYILLESICVELINTIPDAINMQSQAFSLFSIISVIFAIIMAEERHNNPSIVSSSSCGNVCLVTLFRVLLSSYRYRFPVDTQVWAVCYGPRKGTESLTLNTGQKQQKINMDLPTVNKDYE